MSKLKTDFKYTIFALFVNLAQWKVHAINIIFTSPFWTAYTVSSFFLLKLYIQNL